jgi:hypothetical protein
MNSKKACELTIDGWESKGPYEFVHPTGWTITNRILSAKSVWVLHRADAGHGNFKSADDAKRRHAELSVFRQCAHEPAGEPTGHSLAAGTRK